VLASIAEWNTEEIVAHAGMCALMPWAMDCMTATVARLNFRKPFKTCNIVKHWRL